MSQTMLSEEWRPVRGFSKYYAISSWGRVKSLKRRVHRRWGTFRWHHERILKPGTDGGGYLYVGMGKNDKRKNHKIHRLVLKAFVPNPKNKKCGNHIDGVKANNFVDNLEWATHSENTQHAVRLGLFRSSGGKSKLSDDDVRSIRQSGTPIIAEAKKYGVTAAYISNIRCGRSKKQVA